jgi:DNA-binding response OmpR family regulator
MSSEGERPSLDERPRVYVVDDELAILDVLSRGLENAGYKTTTFSSGREFERAAVRESPDICIMDLSLPDVDGVAILNELAAQDYRGRILLMSGHGQQVLRR